MSAAAGRRPPATPTERENKQTNKSTKRYRKDEPCTVYHGPSFEAGIFHNSRAAGHELIPHNYEQNAPVFKLSPSANRSISGGMEIRPHAVHKIDLDRGPLARYLSEQQPQRDVIHRIIGQTKTWASRTRAEPSAHTP